MASQMNEPVVQKYESDLIAHPEELDAWRNELDSNNKNKSLKHKAEQITPLDEDGDYHVRAGRIGGETTKQRHRDSNFYKQIGSLGGTTTMARHGQDYDERRKKGGQTTRERYGEDYYHNIAAKAARSKQEATRLRNEAIKTLLSVGFKIPTIIKLTLKDLEQDPRLQRLAEDGPLALYLEERNLTEADSEYLFVSQSGKPLSLANTYTVMERHRPQE
jgi:uncharacterized protein